MCHATLRCHAVLAQISLCYPPLEGRLLTRYSPVRRSPLLKSTEVSIKSFPLDLHVLGTPPAFVLSQDQTLSYWLYHSLRVIYLIPRKSNSLISSLTKLLSFKAIIILSIQNYLGILKTCTVHFSRFCFSATVERNFIITSVD